MFLPKFHCELAREGIEYSWGAAKKQFRKVPISQKKISANLHLLVSASMDKITCDMVRKFSKRARRYMLTYLHQKVSKGDGNSGEITWDFNEIERIQGIYKSHRDASVFDGRFIQLVMNKSIGLEHSSNSQAASGLG